MDRTQLKAIVTTGSISNRSWQCPVCKAQHQLAPNKAHGIASCSCNGIQYRLVRPEIVNKPKGVTL